MLRKKQINYVLVAIILAGLFSLSHSVQNTNGSDNTGSLSGDATSAPQAVAKTSEGITARAGKSISFFPSEASSSVSQTEPTSERRPEAARRIRFGDGDDANYEVNVISNDISGGSVEIGERRPAVFAYRRPDDGSVYNASPSPNYNNNYYSRPYEYSYNERGQYYNPKPGGQYYLQSQTQGNYYQSQQQQQQVTSSPVSQSYQHIPYPQSQAVYQQQHQPLSRPPPPQYPNRPYSGPPTGPYYGQQQPQGIYNSPQQYDYYSPNYPYPNGGGTEGGLGGLLGGLGSLFSGNANDVPQNGFAGNGGGGGGGPGVGNVGNQFGYAIENIVRYDDYQCVPKIVCQMVGNPQRQSTLPSWLNAPSLTALISAVPSTSPMLVFGRAALLGLSGGERHCDSSYPRCPRNEDDVLNYLNNHRGGFFRFFNGGASYGDADDTDYGYGQQQQQQYQQYQQQPINQQQPIYQQQQPQQQQSQGIAGLDLGTIQSLAEAINSGGGINLSNLGSNLGLLGNLASLGSVLGGAGGGAAAAAPQKQTPASSLGSNLSLLSNLGSQLGLGDTVSNLLTGLIGQRFNGRKSRKLTKRSAEFTEESLDKLLLSLGKDETEEEPDSDGPPSKKRNLNKEIGDDATRVENGEKASLQKRKKYHQEGEKKEKIRQVEKLLGVQARIINKDDIQAEAQDRIVNVNYPLQSDSLLLNPIIFPDDFTTPSQIQDSSSVPQGGFFPDVGQGLRTGNSLGDSFAFPQRVQSGGSEDNRGGKAYQFSHSTVQSASNPGPFNQLQFPETFQNNDGIILDIPRPLPLEYYDHTKMIFPDRTGTGNLRFDNEELFGGPNHIRIGRILTGSNQNSRPFSYQGSYNGNQNAVSFNRGDVLVFHSNQRGQYNDNNYYNGNRQQQQQQFDFGNRYPLVNNNLNSNQFQYQGQYQQQQTQPANYYNNGNRYQSSSSQQQSSQSNGGGGGKVYVTNAQGIVTYYLNERGEKIAV